MSAIPPSAPPARGVEPVRGAIPALVEHAAPRIAASPAGTVLSGTVTGREPGGLVRLETPEGTLVLRTALAIPDGALVKIQIQIAAGQLRAAILDIKVRPEGPAPSNAEAAAARTAGAAPETQLPTSRPAAPSPPVSAAAQPNAAPRPGTLVSARVLTPPPAPPPAAGYPAPAAVAQPQATALTIRIVDILPAAPPVARPTGEVPLPPAPPAAAPSSAAPPATPPPADPAARPATAPPPQPAAPATTQGSPGAAPQAPGQVSSPSPPAAGAAPAATETTAGTLAPAASPLSRPSPAPTPGGMTAATGQQPSSATPTLSGTVMPSAAGQPAVLVTPLGRLAVAGLEALPAYSAVRFQPVAGSASGGNRPHPAAPPAAPSSPAALAQRWPALAEVTEALAATRPDLAAAVVDTAILQPGPRLAQTMLFFLSALRQGDVEGWLGRQAADHLAVSGRRTLLNVLGEDFRQIARVADQGAGDWRAYFIPLHDGETLHQLRFFHRHHSERNADGEDESGDRFLIDLDLSRLGAMQLDGFLRGKRFSVALRSARPLDESQRSDIAEIFHDGCACAGLSGDISFAGARAFVPLPMEKIAETAGKLSV